MILSRFFKPKWQHSNPQIRKQSLEELSATDPVLIQMACEDQDPAVRLAAMDKIKDIGLLRQRALQDNNANVRARAEKRFREMMTGAAVAGVSLESRLAVLEDGLQADFLQFLAVHSNEPRMRLAVLEHIGNTETLVDRVINDPALEVQMAALARLHEPDLLERIARETRNRNKRIHRAARERLAARQAEHDYQQRIAEMCTRMEVLADSGAGANDTRFHILEKDWEQLGTEAGTAFAQRYQRARDSVLNRAHQEAAQRAAHRDMYHALEELLARLESEVEWTPDLATLIDNSLTSQDAVKTGSGLADEAEEQRFAHLREAIRQRERVLHREHERALRLRELLQQADRLLTQSKDVGEDDLSQLKKLWTSLERPETESLTAALQSQFDTVLDKLRTRLQRQIEQQTKRFQELNQMVTDFETVLTQGKLQQAIALNDQVRQNLKKETLPRGGKAILNERLQSCIATLSELRGWRRWGTYQAREHLCEDAESLIESGEEPPVLAKRIQRLRSVWKSLDKTEGAASKNLWERFNNACERAYEPCQAFFDAQARERQANLANKQAICQQLEDFEANADWENVDWRAADRMRNEGSKRWRKIGPVNRADRKDIERRYRAISQRLNNHLKKQREYEVQRREALIQRVEELAAADDLRAAVEGAKDAQAKWQPNVQSSQRQEQDLWQRFRAACDAIFERRQAEQDLVDSERQENLVRKTALCEEIESLADVEDVVHVNARVQAIRQAWASIGNVSPVVYKDIERRFETACQQLERHRRDQQQAKTLIALDSLRERARLCARLESALLEAPDDIAEAIVEARKAWSKMPPVKRELWNSISERFDLICKTLASDELASQMILRRCLEQNREAKQILCLRMEILAGVDSPKEFAQARMECQVSRLSQSLSERDKIQTLDRMLADAQDIEEQWYLTGLLPSNEAESLEERFTHAVQALRRQMN